MGGARTGEGGIEGAAKNKNPGGNHSNLAPANVWVKNLTQILKNATPTYRAVKKPAVSFGVSENNTLKQSQFLLGLSGEISGIISQPNIHAQKLNLFHFQGPAFRNIDASGIGREKQIACI